MSEYEGDGASVRAQARDRGDGDFRVKEGYTLPEIDVLKQECKLQCSK